MAEEGIDSAETSQFSFNDAVENLKAAGSVANWKKNHKDEFKHWQSSEEFSKLKEAADIKDKEKPKPKKTAIIQPIKVTISSHQALALNEILKDRGLKKFDISNVLDEALDAVPEDWWEQKKEELTPIEWKIEKISQNPDLKSKLANQLDELLAQAKSSSVH